MKTAPCPHCGDMKHRKFAGTGNKGLCIDENDCWDRHNSLYQKLARFLRKFLVM